MLDDVVPRFALPQPVERVKHILRVSVADDWEYGLTEGVRALVHAGDRVVIVGGGWGVTAVLHGRAVGEHGQVTVFEGSLPFVERVEETVRLAGLTNVQIVHAVVGAAIDVWDDEPLPELVSEVPMCDVLELDCEGAELQILSTLDHRPRAIAVETHGWLGAPSDEAGSVLCELGYEIKSAVPSDKSDHSRRHDCMVLLALYRATPKPEPTPASVRDDEHRGV